MISKRLKILLVYKTEKEQQQQQQKQLSISSYFPMPVLHVTKIIKTSIRSSSTNNNIQDGIIIRNHDQDTSGNHKTNISQSDNYYEHPISPIEFDWYDDKDNDDDNNIVEIDDINDDNADESIHYHHQHTKRKKYVKISRIYDDSLVFLSDVSNKNTNIKESFNNIKVGQIIIWMNDNHVSTPQQAKDILLQCYYGNSKNNPNHESKNKCYDDIPYLTIVTYEPDDIIVHSIQYPFLKFCIVSNKYDKIHDSECEFSYINNSKPKKYKKQKKNSISSPTSSLNNSNSLLYISYIHPKGLWMNNSTLQCGDIVLSINGYTVLTKNDAKHAIIKSNLYQSPIIYFYVIDFIQLQYYIYQQCIKDIIITKTSSLLQSRQRDEYPYHVHFHHSVDINRNDKKNNNANHIDKHSQTTCQIVFYNNNDKNYHNSSKDIKENDTEKQVTTKISQLLSLSQTTTTTTNGIMIASTKIDVDIWKNIYNLLSYNKKKTEILAPVKSWLRIIPNKYTTYQNVIVPFAKCQIDLLSSTLYQIQNSLHYEIRNCQDHNNEKGVQDDETNQSSTNNTNNNNLIDAAIEDPTGCCECMCNCIDILQCLVCLCRIICPI